MFIIVGLGNPGEKYEKTRHNIGFKAVDEVNLNFQFPVFKFQSVYNAEISKGIINDKKITLVKPQTFMNRSGMAVKKLTKNSKQLNKNLIVIHDDIDLPLGKIRIVKNRGAAGHKGVESIIKELGTKDFIRIRIGIKPEKKGWKTKNDIEKFVLKKFNKEEEKIIKETIKKTAEAVEIFLKDGPEKTMNKFNK